MSLDALRARRGNTEKLIEEINKLGGGSGSRKRTEDARFWKPQLDKLGNSYAVIRFLPSAIEDDLPTPFVSVWDHGFQGPSGRWYIENSLTTVGKDDPVSEYNSTLWNSGFEADKETARKQKRRLHYIGNIYIVKDPANPDNDGKVFLYKFGAKIYAKIKDAMSPPAGFEDETPIIPYDLWEGANFKLKIRKVEGYSNYDMSAFDRPSPLSKSDEELEGIFTKVSSLRPFVSVDGKDADGNPYFKSYDELKEKLYKILDLSTSENNEKPNVHSSAKNTQEVRKAKENPQSTSNESSGLSMDSEEDDQELEFFRKLANGD